MPVAFRPFAVAATFVLLVSSIQAQNSLDSSREQMLPEGPIDFSRTVVLFYSYTCPHCHEEMEYLSQAEERFPELEFVQIEVDQSNNEANKEFFRQTMESLGSNANGWPRTVIGNRVFIGFESSDGPDQWLEPYAAYAGYQNRIEAALAELSAYAAGKPSTGMAAGETNQRGAWRATVQWMVGTIIVLVAYISVGIWMVRRRSTDAVGRRLWIGGALLVVLVGLFGSVTSMPAGELADTVQGFPFPVMVTVVALLDGFNPCAFTVLFILLSLLTHAHGRRQMAVVGGIFLFSSAAVYVTFILAMILLGSFAVASMGSWVLRVIGVVVTTVGVLSLLDSIGHRTRRVRTTVSDEDKASIGRRAGRVIRRFVDADTVGKKAGAVGAILVLAVAVNGVELGCTAILPAIYMSALLSTYGGVVSAPHLLWTGWYGLVYILPMLAILVDFMFTFRSIRMSAGHGRRLKRVGAAVMVALGTVLAVAPQLLAFGA